MSDSPLSLMSALLGAAPRANETTIRIVVLVIMMTVAFGVMGVVLLVIRRNVLSEKTDTGGEGLSLHDIRTLRDTGKVSDEEYERMRALIVPSQREVHPDVAALKKNQAGPAEGPEPGTRESGSATDPDAG